MLRAAGTDIKVQQELLRHSTIQSTMNVYTQAVSEQKRAANTMVVGILFNENASIDQSPANGSQKALSTLQLGLRQPCPSDCLCGA
jgi:hypothetical protein